MNRRPKKLLEQVRDSIRTSEWLGCGLEIGFVHFFL